MSKLDEIEDLARESVQREGMRTVESTLARAVLAMLPVVRAAEAVRSELAVKPRPTDAEVTFALAVDAMRRALEER